MKMKVLFIWLNQSTMLFINSSVTFTSVLLKCKTCVVKKYRKTMLDILLLQIIIF